MIFFRWSNALASYEVDFLSFVWLQLGLIDGMCDVCVLALRSLGITANSALNSSRRRVNMSLCAFARTSVKSHSFFIVASIDWKSFSFFCISLPFKHSSSECVAVVWIKCDILPNTANTRRTSHKRYTLSLYHHFARMCSCFLIHKRYTLQIRV